MRKGGAFRLVGFILGVIGVTISITAVVFSIIGMAMGKHHIKPKVRY